MVRFSVLWGKISWHRLYVSFSFPFPSPSTLLDAPSFPIKFPSPLSLPACLHPITPHTLLASLHLTHPLHVLRGNKPFVCSVLVPCSWISDLFCPSPFLSIYCDPFLFHNPWLPLKQIFYTVERCKEKVFLRFLKTYLTFKTFFSSCRLSQISTLISYLIPFHI